MEGAEVREQESIVRSTLRGRSGIRLLTLRPDSFTRSGTILTIRIAAKYIDVLPTQRVFNRDCLVGGQLP